MLGRHIFKYSHISNNILIKLLIFLFSEIFFKCLASIHCNYAVKAEPVGHSMLIIIFMLKTI